jgi:hypothetical protein
MTHEVRTEDLDAAASAKNPESLLPLPPGEGNAAPDARSVVRRGEGEGEAATCVVVRGSKG